jgi:hypothetical protein
MGRAFEIPEGLQNEALGPDVEDLPGLAAKSALAVKKD